VKVTKVWFN